MNENLASLIYYIKWIKNNQITRDEFEIGANDNPAAYIGAFLDENPIGGVWRRANWHGDNAPLPIDQIDVAADIGQALERVYDVRFLEYVERVCDGDALLRRDVDTLWRTLGRYAPGNANRAYGIAAGRVQSGKTRNYIGLMFRAIDRGFNTVVILTSSNSRLAYQTQKRVRDVFAELHFPNLHWLTQEKEDQDGVEWHPGANFAADQLHIGVILKHDHYMGRLKEWIDNIEDAALRDMKILVIDDEADNASLNTMAIPGVMAINNDADVQRLRRDVLNRHGDHDEDVAAWINDFSGNDIVQEDIDRLQDDNCIMDPGISDTRFVWLFQNDETFARVAGFDDEPQLKDQVVDTFANIGNHQFSRKRLRAFVEYVLDAKRRSSINASLCELFGYENEGAPDYNYGRMFFVGYTATPYGNLLNEDPESDPICPDFVMPLETSTRYFGFERMFNSDPNRQNMCIVRPIPPAEHSAWVCPFQKNQITFGRDDEQRIDRDRIVDIPNEREIDTSSLRRADGEQEVEWQSLKKAVMWAFCTAAARRIYRKAEGGDRASDDDINIPTEYRWTTMLFHLSHLANGEKAVHPVQQKLTRDYIQSQTDTIEHQTAFVEACMQVWDDETRQFTADRFFQSCQGYGADPAPYPTHENVQREICDWFIAQHKYKVIQMNSNRLEEDASDYYRKECEGGDVLWFVCGGNVLSRGLTLDGLTVSYYDRDGGAVDTVIQMCRWFGYRRGYELLPRIWMATDTRDQMVEICGDESQFHADWRQFFEGQVRSLRHGAVPPAMMGSNLTRHNANQEIDTPKFTFEVVTDGGREAACNETLSFLNETLGGDAQCLATLDDWGDPGHIDYRRRHGKFWQGVPGDLVRDFICRMKDNTHYFATESFYQAQRLIRCIDSHPQGQIPCNWDVVVGNPYALLNELRPVDVVGFDGYFRRNNVFHRNADNSVKLGNRQVTFLALLARMPFEFIRQARINLPHIREDSDVRFIEEAYRLMSEANQQVKPVLLIDFVNGDHNLLFVQISYYWHGLRPPIYVRAARDRAEDELLPFNEQNLAPQGDVLNQDDNHVGPSDIALERLPGWAEDANLNPHKLIKVFLELSHGNVDVGVPYAAFRQRCIDANVGRFSNAFYYMRHDDRSQYGRVFVRDGDQVRIVPEVRETIRQYINQFMEN